ncbi:hypothetical protein [Propionivibrio limicola]|uniref:hypothetical protein n=1 Tax=Propionivibrio limicola TaxID=167645 RepID=UPI001291D609|nr:hypothetical protein [Propionivibrio limicola]
MSRSTADWLLRLEADAWVLHTPAGVQRQAHDGAPESALERLAGDTAARGTRLHTVLGDGWLRYLVMRWPAGVQSREERAIYMAYRFDEVHGASEPEWAFALDRDAVNFPALACAAPASLLAAIQAFAAAHGLRPGRIVGDFVDCFNQLRQRFDEPPGTLAALALIRPERLTVGLWCDGRWQAIRSRTTGNNSAGPNNAAELCHMLAGWHAELAPEQTGMLYVQGPLPVVCAGWSVIQEAAP